MAEFTYKKDDCEPISASDYAIRYGAGEQYAKVKGGKEFNTDFRINNSAYEVYLGQAEQ